jgi:hypothetical protein
MEKGTAGRSTQRAGFSFFRLAAVGAVGSFPWYRGLGPVSAEKNPALAKGEALHYARPDLVCCRREGMAAVAGVAICSVTWPRATKLASPYVERGCGAFFKTEAVAAGIKSRERLLTTPTTFLMLAAATVPSQRHRAGVARRPTGKGDQVGAIWRKHRDRRDKIGAVGPEAHAARRSLKYVAEGASRSPGKDRQGGRLFSLKTIRPRDRLRNHYALEVLTNPTGPATGAADPPAGGGLVMSQFSHRRIGSGPLDACSDHCLSRGRTSIPGGPGWPPASGSSSARSGVAAGPGSVRGRSRSRCRCGGRAGSRGVRPWSS